MIINNIYVATILRFDKLFGMGFLLGLFKNFRESLPLTRIEFVPRPTKPVNF